jgi:acyl-CoA reductase-like NAD-dependent aldehyde dehydrogenase
MAPSAIDPSTGSHAIGAIDFTSFSNVINGKLTHTSEQRHGINPATKKPNPEVPVATQQDVDDAVKAGKEAFKTWSKTSIDDRRKALQAYASALKENAKEFAELLTREQGKPVSSE